MAPPSKAPAPHNPVSNQGMTEGIDSAVSGKDPADPLEAAGAPVDAGDGDGEDAVAAAGVSVLPPGPGRDSSRSVAG